MTFDLDINWGELKVKTEALLSTVEEVLTDLAPIESLLPIPASAKAFVADLQVWIADADDVLNEI